MTDAQWLFEYHALQAKEKMEGELQVKLLEANARVLRDTLIGVLGLHLLAPQPAPDAPPREEDAPVPFVPAVMLFSNHHLLNIAMAQQKKSAGVQVEEDEAFEAFSQRLARGDVGDLDPIHTADLSTMTATLAERERRAAEARLGIQQRPADAPAAAHFGRAVTSAHARVTLQPQMVAPTLLSEDELFGHHIELEPGLFPGDGRG